MLIQWQTPYTPFLLSITQSYYSNQIILRSSYYKLQHIVMIIAWILHVGASIVLVWIS